jgi:hypothetical protein
MSWSEVAASLTAETVTGGASGYQSGVNTAGASVAGDSVNWEVVRGVHAAQVTWAGVSGGPSGDGGELTVELMGSLDGENWYQVASITGFNTGATAQVVSEGIQPAQYLQAVATAYTYPYNNGAQPANYTGTLSVLVISQ